MDKKRNRDADSPGILGPGEGKAPEASRTLLHIPIIHNEADMGVLSQTIKQLTIRKLGEPGWERNVNLIETLWARIEQGLDRWSLNYPRVRLYQDGLPVCGRELEIVTDLAKAGSRNHQLLLRLREHGATIMGTESAELLVQEYQLIKRILEGTQPSAAPGMTRRQKALSQSLLERRDQAIAQRINDTLQAGETGILFLGMLHAIAGRIAADIRVVCPIAQYWEGAV